MDLKSLRKKIDEIDDELVDVISRRISLMPEIAEKKRRENVGSDQQDREREVIDNIRKKAEEKGLDPNFMEKIMSEIITESKKIQKKNM